MSSHRITGLLRAWHQGDDEALAALTPMVHAELRGLARAYMRGERAGHTLQATALVNECYMRLLDTRGVEWQSRGHFFALAARMMRRILVDFARARQYAKRGGPADHLPIEPYDEHLCAAEPTRDLIALDAALRTLAAVDERRHRIVELRFFGGYSHDDIAAALDISSKTVMREWQAAKAWLLDELAPNGPAGRR